MCRPRTAVFNVSVPDPTPHASRRALLTEASIPTCRARMWRRSKRERNMSVTFGSGGPLVRLVTTNGGIHLNKS